MQRKLYIDFELLLDSISATAFGRGYMVPISQFFEGFICSSLVHVGYVVYPFSCNVIGVSNKTYRGLANQMHQNFRVYSIFCSEGKMMYIIFNNYTRSPCGLRVNSP